MCGRIIKLFLFCILVLAFGARAEARKQNFYNKSGIGFAFRAGVAGIPENETLNTPRTSAGSYTTILGFEPFVDFDNFGIRGVVAWNRVPSASASGTDTVLGQNFNESSEVSVLNYGGSVMFYPYYSAKKESRAYFGAGGGLAHLYMENKRGYVNASGVQLSSHTMKAQGSTTYLQGFLGFEFFLVQNYTLGLEAGYRAMKYNDLEYKTSTDARGTNVDIGTPVRNVSGVKAGYNLSGVYGMVSFALLF